MIDIKEIKSLDQLKDLKDDEMSELAEEVRDLMIESVARNGGYLASELSLVEIVIAILKSFDLKNDKIIFDDSHGAYTYKILTGRYEGFKRLGKCDGVSHYLDPSESKYDGDDIVYGLSLAVSLAEAKTLALKKKNGHVVCVIGDEAILSKDAFEVLRDIGKMHDRLIIVLNDNADYRKKVTTSVLQRFLNDLRDNKEYLALKKSLKTSLNKSEAGRSVAEKITMVKNSIRAQVIDGGIFSLLGINYIGPIDGHDLKMLLKALSKAKSEDGPIVIHCLSKKGRGYPMLEEGLKVDTGLSKPFDAKTGRRLAVTPNDHLSYDEIIALSLEKLIKRSDEVIALISHINDDEAYRKLYARYPERIFKIDEISLSVAMCYTLAKAGYRPFLLLDSRYIAEYIALIKELIIRYKIPCVIGLKNAGVIANEGDHRQGIYDISLLSSFDDVTIVEGHSHREIVNLFYLGFLHNGPYFIRIPDVTIALSQDDTKLIEYGTWTYLRKVKDSRGVIIAYGTDLDVLLKELTINDIPYDLIDARFILPLDTKILDDLRREDKKIIVYSLDHHRGGIADLIRRYLADSDIVSLAIDRPVISADMRAIRKELKMDWKDIDEVLKK